MVIDQQIVLLEFLKNTICGDFAICNKISYGSNEKTSLYSPAFLGLIGSILSQIPINHIKPVISTILNKLHITPNEFGIYNFLGDRSYFDDIDTTVLINNFILDREINNEFIKNIDSVLDSLQTPDNGYLTWIRKPSNNLDWVVNLNVFIYLKQIKSLKSRDLYLFLKNRICQYLEFGSKYYPDNNLPLFFLLFYYNKNILSETEFNDLSIIKSIDNPQNSNLNILSLCTEILLKIDSPYLNLEKIIQIIGDQWRIEIRYTSSSTSYYVSEVLNAAVALYLLTQIKSLINEKK